MQECTAARYNVYGGTFNGKKSKGDKPMMVTRRNKEITQEQGVFLGKIMKMMDSKSLSYGELYTACCALVAEEWVDVDKNKVQEVIDGFKQAFPKDDPRDFVSAAMAMMQATMNLQALDRIEELGAVMADNRKNDIA